MPRRMRVTIAGGGLAGLLAARVLREKHSVTVIERASGNHEFSAAITLGPTAIVIAESLGLDRARAALVTSEKVCMWTKDLHPVSETHTSRYADKLDANFSFAYRIALWDEFRRLATSEEFPGEPATILWNTSVVDADVVSGTIRTDKGEVIECDLLIAADGVRSMIRPLVVGKDDSTHARPSGSSAFRCTVPTDTVRRLHQKHGLQSRGDPLAPDMNLYLSRDGTQRTMVSYPCDNGRMLNMAFVVPDPLVARETTESWSAEAEPGEIRRLFHDFHPFIVELAENAQHPKCWKLREQDPLPTYTRGRTMLIGDAAHAMTPHLGQGGTQSIEDAAAFELFNDPDFDSHSVPEILRMMDSVRRPRVSNIQLWTREYQEWKKTGLVEKYTWYCWTYPGIKTCLRRLAAGQEMIEMVHWREPVEEELEIGKDKGVPGHQDVAQVPLQTITG